MMFEQLVESEPEGAEFRNRKSYFMVSSVVVGILFLTAVVISIYAADFGLGSSAFELVEMIAPTEMVAVEPEAPETRVQRGTVQEQLPTRQANMLRMDETPVEIPRDISTTRNAQMARPDVGRFRIGPVDTGDGQGSGREVASSGPLPPGIATAAPEVVRESDRDDPPPPPVIKKDPPRPRPLQSLGVINGRASYLPKPVYSAAAVAVHAEGKVDVQVTIDEAGRVISATAVSGNVLLRPAAEQAARNARFTPTLLSNVPVKVTGVIVYNFTR